MVVATLYFENDTVADVLVRELQDLPVEIKPVYFTEDEGEVIADNLLSDQTKFRDFRKANPTGFFLYSGDKTFFDVSIRRIGYADVTLYLADGLPGELVVAFFRVLARHKPIFGFACDEEEYKHRNRYYITIGKNHIEDWIGRRLEKYISGVYWQTLLSDASLSQHGVNVADLYAEAMSTETLTDRSLHLLRFFEKPQDWRQHAERLDNLCERVDGMFSKRSVESAVSGVSSYAKYDEIIAEWR